MVELHVNAWGINRKYKGLDSLEVSLDFIRDDLIVDVKDIDENTNLAEPYNGQYDNLLFFFTHMYNLIHHYYDHNLLLAYRRPIF